MTPAQISMISLGAIGGLATIILLLRNYWFQKTNFIHTNLTYYQKRKFSKILKKQFPDLDLIPNALLKVNQQADLIVCNLLVLTEDHLLVIFATTHKKALRAVYKKGQLHWQDYLDKDYFLEPEIAKVVNNYHYWNKNLALHDKVYFLFPCALSNFKTQIINHKYIFFWEEAFAETIKNLDHEIITKNLPKWNDQERLLLKKRLRSRPGLKFMFWKL